MNDSLGIRQQQPTSITEPQSITRHFTICSCPYLPPPRGGLTQHTERGWMGLGVKAAIPSVWMHFADDDETGGSGNVLRKAFTGNCPPYLSCYLFARAWEVVFKIGIRDGNSVPLVHHNSHSQEDTLYYYCMRYMHPVSVCPVTPPELLICLLFLTLYFV